MWYNSGHQGWGSKAMGRNTSVVDAEPTPASPVKPSAGRIIRIVNNMDPSVQVLIRTIHNERRMACIDEFSINSFGGEILRVSLGQDYPALF